MSLQRLGHTLAGILSTLLVLHFKEGLDQLGRIQRRVMGIIRGLENITCEERLKASCYSV